MEQCKHEHVSRFHHTSPLYCEDCGYYLEYRDLSNSGSFKLEPINKIKL
jgi:hypothetical protein